MTRILKTLMIATAATILLALSAYAQGAELGSKHWQLTYLNGKAVGQSKAYMEIDPTAARFDGNAGCNRMFGSVKVSGRSIAFSAVGMTRMACVNANVMKLEGDLVKALEQATSYRLDGDSLSIYARNRRILRFKGNAVSGGDPVKTAKLEDKKWFLESLGGRAVGDLGKTAFINFDAARGSAGGDTSCNVFGGSYVVKGNTLAVKDVISTMRACIEDDRMNIERSFLDGLQRTNRFEIRGGLLSLYKGEELLLTFRGENK